MIKNREFKFRLWDTAYNKWSKVCNQLLNRDGAEKYYIFNQNNRFIYQQFTGLLDVKGKEIYEGDILEFFPKRKGFGYNKFIGYVFYENEEAKYYHTFLEGRPPKCFWGRFSEWEYKVIGNTFENPELLKNN